ALAYGLDPRHAPASAALLPYMEQTFGSWYVAGGMRELARAVYERCLARKVEFGFGSEVTSVVVRDGRAAGVELSGGAVADADHVVAGADTALAAGQELWEDGDVRPQGEPGAGQLPGRFTVLLGLSGARPASAVHRSVVHSPDNGAEAAAVFGGRLAERPTVTVLRPDDPRIRPDDAHEAVTLTATVTGHGGAVDWRDKALRERCAEALIDAAGTAVEDLRARALWQEILTPAETGAVPAPSLAGLGGRYLHPANSTRLPGLHLVGGHAHPGGGLAHAGMSGALVAGLIVEGADFRGSQ
ncbi:phytoene desaturase family protein, partial [Streptomyces sp. NPDC056437]|uniref:phytoene desaturase family protein n=1 Tax=Streptomyces sp. NPDC056437 TaxID=3345816 RepID=UPI00367DAE23